VKCAQVREALTAYLDGELEGERGSAVRGHLRGCQACRDAARDEAALRDGLRALPPVDPPASLWAGVQARLAQAEVADAEKPGWRRALARIRAALAWRWRPFTPPAGLAGLAVAVAIVLVVWHARRTDAPAPTSTPEPVAVAPQHDPKAESRQPKAESRQPDPADVSDALATDATRETQDYAQAAAELAAVVDGERAKWSDERKQAYDTRVTELRAKIAGAAEGRPRQRAYRTLIRYLQHVAIRDDVVLAGVP
jgi:anti-sigma factor RsiW